MYEYVNICIEMAFSDKFPTVKQFENNIPADSFVHTSCCATEGIFWSFYSVLKPLGEKARKSHDK